MSIKEAIERGLYPTDGKGRALVPTRGGGVATVTETNSPLTQPLMGWLSGEREGHDWYADGHWNNLRQPHRFDLLPPPPRKVVRWAALSHEQLDALGMYESDGPAQREVCGGKMLARIEYEVKW